MCTEEQDGVNFILCTKKSAPGSERADIPGKLTRPEGIYIKIKDDTALICGSDERGLIYAVYEFLESYAHCCFAAYSSPDANTGEIIPHAEALKSADGEYIKNGADLPYRSAIVQFGESAGNAHHSLNVRSFDRLVKNRYNRTHVVERLRNNQIRRSAARDRAPRSFSHGRSSRGFGHVFALFRQ